MDPDPDPGGPKTCGSGGYGSAPLVFLYQYRKVFFGVGGVVILALLANLKPKAHKTAQKTKNKYFYYERELE
jgi:hypothetical protein